MNLAWIAAVLEPLDIALDPHFPDDEYDSTGPARLAATVLGRQWRRQLESEVSSAEPHDLVDLAQGCLRNDLIAESVPQLAAALIESPPSDRAESAALALIVASASGELDDYSTCLMVLDSQLSRTQRESTADDALLTAVLLQQKALRMRDAGKAYLGVSAEAERVLSSLVVERCSSFRMRSSVSHSPYVTLARMRDGLLYAISSLVPLDAPERQKIAGLSARQTRTLGQEVSVTARTARGRANGYAEYVRNSFTREFDTRSSVVIGGTGYVDLFPHLLSFELIGDSAVYPARRELALLRLLQSEGSEVDLADALRLLRQAAAKKDLGLVLRRLRDAGPLSAISRDGRQILQRRTSPELLRTVELQVLEAAADLLTPTEARLGLEAIKASLAAGGPPDLPGMWQLAVLRREAAWRAAAALANMCSAGAEVSDMLLAEVKADSQDRQLFDTAVQRALSVLDWDSLPDKAKEAWATIMLSHQDRLPRVSSVIADRLGRIEPPPTGGSSLDMLVYQLNLAIKEQVHDRTLIQDAEQLVQGMIENVRSEAASGVHSFGGINPGDVAASLIVVTGSRSLWRYLAGLLTDMRVPRDARTPAFERLARANVLIPERLVESFRAHAQKLLYGKTPVDFDSPLCPYPAALRFLGAFEILQDADVYDAIATLAGGRTAASRREAAVTAAILAHKRPLPALLALVLPLVGDENPEVRAAAGRALVLLQDPNDLGVVAGRRIVDLLAEDGILVPMVVLRELGEVSGSLSPSIRRRVEEVSERHSSQIVRARAKEVIEQSGQG